MPASPKRSDNGSVPASPDRFTPLTQSDKKLSFKSSGQGRRTTSAITSGSGGGGMEQAAAAAATTGGVNRGTAGSFDPSLLAGGATNSGGRNEGFFVARDSDLKELDLIDQVSSYHSSMVC